jgi:hypothetical protein
VFAIDAFTITATAGSNGSISPSGTVNLNYGSNQTFTITPNTGYHVDSVYVDGSSAGAVTSYPFTNVTANHTIHAVFAIDAFTITASAGSNGSISPSGTVNLNYGSNQTFTITPNTGYHVDSVYVDGSNAGAVTSYPFTNVTANHTIHATFAINVFTITASAGNHGSITPNGIVNVNYADSVIFIMHPDAGYRVDSIFVDGIYVGSDSVWILRDVASNHAIHTTFKLAVSVDDTIYEIPKDYALKQNYPNPFNPTTTIRIDLPEQSVVTLKIYNVLGREIKTLIDRETISAGVLEVTLDASQISSGLYFYRLIAEKSDGKPFESTKKMMLVK